MRIAILHNAVTSADGEHDRDVLEQVHAVAEALQTLGHEPESFACTLDLDALRSRLLHTRPRAVFNLVESLGGSDWLIHLVPGLLDVLGLPYTGSPTEAIFLSTQKLLAKERLTAAGLPTPAWIASGDSPGSPRLPPLGFSPQVSPGPLLAGEGPGVRARLAATAPDSSAQPWILKTVWEHASFAIEEESLLAKAPDDWAAWLADRRRRLGRPCFAEQFVDGREFNLSLLASAEGVQVLPPAEIDFSRFPADKPRIVGYRAKWIAESPEYQGTPRRFDCPPADQPLLDRLRELTQACWGLFGLRGYARVDFRVDADGTPWVLEINSNPCLSPDAGFMAAAGEARLTMADVVARILADAVAGR